MRGWIAGASLALLITTEVALGATAGRLAPKDIETTFFNGQPFTASTTSGNVKFKMVFTADGKMTREPLGKSGAKSEGTWKLSQDGFCTTWKGSKQNCYQLRSSGSNKWAVISGTTSVANWAK
jgi:hypothetical protein